MVIRNYYDYGSSGAEEKLLKIDSDLNPVFFKSFPNFPHRAIRALSVSDNGSMYTTGDITYMNADHTVAYLRKYDPNGESGNCASTALVADFKDIPFTRSSLNVIPVNKIYTGSPGAINLVSTPSQFHLANSCRFSQFLRLMDDLLIPGRARPYGTNLLPYPGCFATIQN